MLYRIPMWRQKIKIGSDADPYLSRELSVCSNTIKRIKKTLELMEQKHNRTTEAFMEEMRSGRLREDVDLEDDYEAWKSSYESLRKWEDLEKQYREAYRTGKK